MKSLQLAKERATGTPSLYLRLAGILIFGLISSAAFASEGESVHLFFGKSDNITLIVSAILGLVGIATAFIIGKKVVANDRGDEKMIEVQNAIEDGARAYLSKQITMMIPFIVILAILLFFLNFGAMKAMAVLVSITFIVGVVSSYASGYAGMLMAVNGNARVAAAALKSNKKALEIAFQSGSVAGLATVGIGLFCSAVILVLLPKYATTLLVGYGFGGSLAALFMRVGGGIYTKAADVGADLVGKVESSLAEDSPKNPATIADNVGDNVGDCAGMAADVFESYEVMLVATIVLGAATSAILDANVWPKLIVFALAACGLGIVSSIFGIKLVKGNDDLESDPLKPILSGFHYSALISAVGIIGLSFLFLRDVNVQELVNQKAAANRMSQKIFDARDRIATTKKIEKTAVAAKDVMDDPEIKALDLGQNAERLVSGTLMAKPEQFKDITGLEGYREISSTEIQSRSLPALNYAVAVPSSDPAKPDTTYTTVAEKFEQTKERLIAVKIKVEQGAPGQGGEPAQKSNMDLWVGGSTEAVMNKQFENLAKSSQQNGGTFKITPDKSKVLPIKLYYNEQLDKFAVVAGLGVDKPETFQPVESLAYYRSSVSDMETFTRKSKSDPKLTAPEQLSFELASEQVVAPAQWWRFALAVIFGILMAIGIEVLTNYYVGTKNKPTQEVAGVASAGPAPMVIQGFAYGAESSVFMVLAIVVALMVPLIIFPASVYGSMTLGFYGIALVGLGLLTTTGFILAMDTFGPISDNAQGVFEMSGQHDNYGSTSLQRLDAAGNTTKALTKGFAIATAVVAAVALFQSFVGAGHLQASGLRVDTPEIFMGLLIGAAAPFLFSSFAINAVGRAAFELIHEVRRQFKANPNILGGDDKPDYGRCVAIVTAAAQRELLGPGILAICLPVAVGFGFSLIPGGLVTIGDQSYNLKGAQALGGFLAGAIASGQLMAVLLANSGGMWDNAKKLIEDKPGGKGTDEHKAAVVCDTVGDPFKDTAGPALNPLIKVMNLVALLVVGAVTAVSISFVFRVLITLVAVGLLVFAFMRSKKGSLADMMQHMAD